MSSDPAGQMATQVLTPELTACQLMAVATHTARQLLGRRDTGDAASLVAGWGALLDAGADLLDANRSGEGTPTLPEAQRAGASLPSTTISRLRLEAHAFGADAVATPVHSDIERVIEAWEQAAALLRRPGHTGTSPPATQPAQPAEPRPLVAAAVTETLSVVVHATGLRLARQPGALNRETIDGLTRMTHRHEHLLLGAHRQLSTSRLPGRMLAPAAANTGLGPSTDGATRAGSAPARSHLEISDVELPTLQRQHGSADVLLARLEEWAPQAIHTVMNPQSAMRDLTRVAQTEVGATWAVGALVAAAGHRGELSPRSVTHLMDRFQNLSEHWRWTAAQWGWVRRYGADESTSALLGNANALTKALSAAALTDPAYASATGGASRTWAAPAVVSERLAGAAVTPLIQRQAENSAILTELFRRLPDRLHRHDTAGRLRPALYAPERVLRRIAQHDHEREQQRFRPGSSTSANALATPVESIRGDKLVAMTTEAAWLLRNLGDRLVEAAAGAELAVGALNGPTTTYQPAQASPNALSPAWAGNPTEATSPRRPSPTPPTGSAPAPAGPSI